MHAYLKPLSLLPALSNLVRSIKGQKLAKYDNNSALTRRERERETYFEQKYCIINWIVWIKRALNIFSPTILRPEGAQFKSAKNIFKGPYEFYCTILATWQTQAATRTLFCLFWRRYKGLPALFLFLNFWIGEFEIKNNLFSWLQGLPSQQGHWEGLGPLLHTAEHPQHRHSPRHPCHHRCTHHQAAHRSVLGLQGPKAQRKQGTEDTGSEQTPRGPVLIDPALREAGLRSNDDNSTESRFASLPRFWAL